MLTYNFNKKLNILETKASGILRIGDIVNHYKELSKNDSLPFSLKILIDCRETDFKVSASEIDLTHDVVREALTKFTTVREAILVNQPHATVVASLFQEAYYDLKKYSFMIFSTESAALSWLK